MNGEIHQQTVNTFTVDTGGRGQYIPGDADVLEGRLVEAVNTFCGTSHYCLKKDSSPPSSSIFIPWSHDVGMKAKLRRGRKHQPWVLYRKARSSHCKREGTRGRSQYRQGLTVP